MILEWKKSHKNFLHYNAKDKLMFLFTLSICCLLLFSSVYLPFKEILKLIGLNTGILYVSEMSQIILLFLYAPTCFFIFIMVLQRILGFDHKAAIMNMLVCAKWGIPLFLLCIYPLNYYAESRLESAGFSYCSWYGGSSLRGPDIWIKDENLCLKDGNLISSKILDWFDTQKELGIEPTLETLNKFIVEENNRIKKEIYGL